MTDLEHRAGRCSPVTLSNEKAPSPIRVCPTPAPARLRPTGTAHGRRTADCRSRSQSAWPASHDLDLTTGPFVHADLKRE
jgi:hypothetical protein